MANRNIFNADASSQQEASQQVGNLGKVYNNALDAAQSLTDEEKILVGLSKELQNSLNNVVASMVLRNNESRTLKKITEELRNLEKSRALEESNFNNKSLRLNQELNKQITERNDTLIKLNVLGREQLNIQDQIQDSQDTINQLQYDQRSLQAQRIEAIKNEQYTRARALQLQIATKANEIANERAQTRGFKEHLKLNIEQTKLEEKALETAREKEKVVQDNITHHNGIIGQLNDEIELLKEAKKQQAFDESKKKFDDFLKSKWLKIVGVLALDKLVETLFQADTQVTNLAENLGISRKSAQGIRTEFLGFVQTVKDGSISVTNMMEAQATMSKELGISVRYSNQELKTFNDLTKLMGVSVESSIKLNSLSTATGIEYKKYVQDILVGAFESEKQLNVQMSNKDILEEVGKLSAGILIKFQNNPIALGKAVIEAKKLGLSLEQVDKIGESLLNWESSIESTLKAELLTGRQLNFERARAAALVGDQTTLMQEISSQLGKQEDFTKLNVLAQKSLAESFGMSREELSEMLLKQDLINKYGSEASKLSAKQAEEFKNSGKSLSDFLYDQGKQVALQEQFNNSVDKLKQIFVDLAQGPFAQMVKMVVSMLNNTALMKGMFIAISAIVGGSMLSSLVKSVQLMTSLVSLSRLKAIYDTWSAAELTAGIGALVGVAAATYAISQMPDQTVKDGIAPSSNGPFTITDKFGGTAITTEGDSIAVSPNINKESSNSKALEDKLDRLISLHQQHLEVAKSGTTLQINEFALGKASPVATAKENSRNFY